MEGAAWTRVGGALLALIGVGLLLAPDLVGYAAAGAWILFVLLPTYCSRKMTRAVAKGDLRRARLYAIAAEVLHPFEDYRRERLALASVIAGNNDPLASLLIERANAIVNTRDRAAASSIMRSTKITKMLIAVNVGCFLLSIVLGGLKSEADVARIGALIPYLVAQGEYWRIVTANFLHFDPIHLTMNMLGLWILGPAIETHLGKSRFLAAYLISGFGSLGVVVLLTRYGFLEEAILLGASGSIMGLVGTTGAIVYRAWRRSPSPRTKQQLNSIILIVVLQSLFDITTPQVSFSAHFGGVVIGFMVGYILDLREPKR